MMDIIFWSCWSQIFVYFYLSVEEGITDIIQHQSVKDFIKTVN